MLQLPVCNFCTPCLHTGRGGCLHTVHCMMHCSCHVLTLYLICLPVPNVACWTCHQQARTPLVTFLVNHGVDGQSWSGCSNGETSFNLHMQGRHDQRRHATSRHPSDQMRMVSPFSNFPAHSDDSEHHHQHQQRQHLPATAPDAPVRRVTAETADSLETIPSCDLPMRHLDTKWVAGIAACVSCHVAACSIMCLHAWAAAHDGAVWHVTAEGADSLETISSCDVPMRLLDTK